MDASSPHIKRATGADADRVNTLIHASSAYHGEYAPILDGYRLSTEYLELHPTYLAVDEDDTLMGFYSLLVDPATLARHDFDVPELNLLFVDDRLQGKGIGRMLIGHMLDLARSEGLTEIRVVSNPPAEAFYRSVGAEWTGTVPPSPPRVTWERPELRFRL
ncbi:GNAT family N-acetyltransferase [Glycomyces sp. NPDC048151]|uniref:GNAT family N-acetyltransferase n=1 Tax=Glycomyces sp. NPDC048151 TaxID=3364002 RepID=UPI003722371D